MPPLKKYRQHPSARITIDHHSQPVEDLVDRPYGKWIVRSYYGKRITESATCVDAKGAPVRNFAELWTCECACGRTGNVMRSNLVAGYSTQCMTCQIADRTTPQNLRGARWKVWKRIKCNQTWGLWSAFQVWDAQQTKETGQRLLRKDASLPHGPDNSFYGTESPQYDADIALLAEVDGVSVEAMRQHYATKTRQAVSQAAKAVRERRGELGS